MLIAAARAVVPLLATAILCCLCAPVVHADPFCARYPEALQEASRIREIIPQQKPCCRQVSKEQFTAFVKEIDPESFAPGTLRAQGAAFSLLGMIPHDYDFARCSTKAAIESLAAFYHQQRKCVIVPDWQETGFDVLVHEATHALQDEAFHISKHFTPGMDSDRTLALRALAEGDAIFVQEKFPAAAESEAPHAAQSPDDSCRLPDTLEYILEFPYFFGNIFVSRYREALGTKGVDALFRDPPRTTKEVLYRDKYAGAEYPEWTPQKPPAGCHIRFKDSLGEYLIRTWIRQYLGSPVALLAARGWSADALWLCEKPHGEMRLGLSTLWESEKDAAEFIEALQKIFSGRPEISAEITTISPRQIFMQVKAASRELESLP